MSQQTKFDSLIEACVNTTVGLIVTSISLPIINWIFDIPMTRGQMVWSTIAFTIISVARSYFIRRFFNNLSWIKLKIKKLVFKFTS